MPRDDEPPFWRQFSLAKLLMGVTVVSLVIALATFPARRKQKVIRIYDTQKNAFDHTSSADRAQAARRV